MEGMLQGLIGPLLSFQKSGNPLRLERETLDRTETETRRGCSRREERALSKGKDFEHDAASNVNRCKQICG